MAARCLPLHLGDSVCTRSADDLRDVAGGDRTDLPCARLLEDHSAISRHERLFISRMKRLSCSRDEPDAHRFSLQPFHWTVDALTSNESAMYD